MTYRTAPKAPSLLDDLQTALLDVTPETLAAIRGDLGIPATKVQAPHATHVTALVLYVALHQEHLEPLLRSLHARRIPRPPEDRPRP